MHINQSGGEGMQQAARKEIRGVKKLQCNTGSQKLIKSKNKPAAAAVGLAALPLSLQLLFSFL